MFSAGNSGPALSGFYLYLLPNSLGSQLHAYISPLDCPRSTWTQPIVPPHHPLKIVQVGALLVHFTLNALPSICACCLKSLEQYQSSVASSSRRPSVLSELLSGLGSVNSRQHSWISLQSNINHASWTLVENSKTHLVLPLAKHWSQVLGMVLQDHHLSHGNPSQVEVA